VIELYGALKHLADITGSLSDPDVVSEVLLEILERPAIVSDIRSPDAYLRLLLRRRQFVRLRRASTEQRLLQFLELPRNDTAEETRLEAAVDVALLLERFRDRLTPEELVLLSLRFWETRDLRTIAETLGISYSSAAGRVFRLLARLRLWLLGE
jgi:RNA polymerase sigma factor (sigma-70 family)